MKLIASTAEPSVARRYLQPRVVAFIGLSIGLLFSNIPAQGNPPEEPPLTVTPAAATAPKTSKLLQTSSVTKLSSIEQSVSHHTVTAEDIQKLVEFIIANPNDSFARYLMARCFEQKGYALLSAEQDELAAASWQDPTSVLELFKHHIEEGDTRAAFPMSQLIYHKFPNSPYRPFMDALFHEEYGRRTLAQPVYETLVMRADRPLGAATRLSAFELEKGNYKRALELTSLDLKTRPDYMPALVAQAEAMARIGKAAEAARMLEPHLQANPFSRRLTLSLYRTLSQVGRYEEALGAAMRAMAIADSAGTPEAMKRVRKIMDVLPEKVQYKVLAQVTEQVDKTEYAAKFHFRMGEILMDLKRPAAALVEYKDSLYFNDEQDAPRLRLGCIMEKNQRRYQDAMAQYEKIKMVTVGDNRSLSIRRLRERLGNRSRDIAWRIQDFVAEARGLNMPDPEVTTARK